MDTNFEQIIPWNGANDTGKDVRLKWQRNFDRIKANFEELSDLFEKVNLGTDEAPAWAIRAKYGLYTDDWISAKGPNPDSPAAVAGGLDEEQLAEYLDTHQYATQTWITQQGYATQSWANGQFAKATVAINAGTGLTGGGTLTASRTLSLATVGTAGTYTKVTVDAYGRVTGHQSLAAADIPTLSISKVSGLQSALNNKLDASDFSDLFEKVALSGGGYAIRAKYGLYSDDWLSVKGANPDAGGAVAGVTELAKLTDVTISNPQDGQGLVYRNGTWKNETVDTGASSWDEITGRPSPLVNDTYYYGHGYLTTDFNEAMKGGAYYTMADQWPDNGPGTSYRYGALAVFNTGSYNQQVAQMWISHHSAADGGVYVRMKFEASDSSWGTWLRLMDSACIGSYNAGSATRLQTARTLWGQPFNGTANVSGDITGAGSITASGELDSFNFCKGKQLTEAPTNFQTDIFGNTIFGYRLKVLRTDFAAKHWASNWSSMLAFTTNDTHGYLSISYAHAAACYIGGGNGDAINWQATLYNDSMDLVPNRTDYRIGSSSMPYYETYSTRLYTTDFIQIGNGRLYWDASTGAIFAQQADGTQCGFYATGFMSAKGKNADAGGTVPGGGGTVNIADIEGMADEWKVILSASDIPDTMSRWPTWAEVTNKPTWIGSSKPSYSFSEITGTPSVTLSSNSSNNLTVNVEGASKTISSLYATYLGGTTKAGLFTGLSYSGSKLSITVGGTTRSVTINAGSSSPSLSISSSSGTNITVNVGGTSKTISKAFATYLSTHGNGVNVSNIDDISYNGLYSWGSSTGGTKPSSGFGLLLHISNYSEKPSVMSWCWRAQLGFGTDGHLFYRISVNSSTWQAWKMIM